MSARTLETALARAISDYLAVSRGFGSYDFDAYERAEEAAWGRLVAALPASETSVEPDAPASDTAESEAPCTASR